MFVSVTNLHIHGGALLFLFIVNALNTKFSILHMLEMAINVGIRLKCVKKRTAVLKTNLILFEVYLSQIC